MIVPLNWLKKYVDIDISVEEFVDKMVMAGNEVEGWERQGDDIKRVVVGRCISVERHPNADRLFVCKMDVGTGEELTICTGADNVFEGALVPVALDGSILPCGKSIKAGKMRGVASQGMLCSPEELLLTADEYPGADVDGILILKDTEKVGADMREVLGRDDVIIDFSILANRPDCMGIIGLAREAAAVLGKKLNLPEANYISSGHDINDDVKIEIHNGGLCPRYVARVVKGLKIAPSPQWMQRALRAAGVRPISNVVDITNYVMLETGQPLHAFDLRDVKDSTIIVRNAHEGEHLTTLDGKERTLTSSMLVIADSKDATGLAGIMGGLDSEIKDDTADVLLESANFLGTNIRVTSRALGMRTEASARNEKGLDKALPEYASRRAIALMAELCGGSPSEGSIDICAAPIEQKQLKIDANRVRAHLGVDVPTDAMVDILNRLELVTTADGDTLDISPPPFRQDISSMADISEEVIRLYGYNHINATMPSGVVKGGGRTAKQSAISKLYNLLASLGYDTVTSFSMIGDKLYDILGDEGHTMAENSLRVLNPLGEEYSLMRASLLPSVLKLAQHNFNQGNRRVRLAELDRVILKRGDGLDELPDQRLSLCLVAINGDFFQLKGEAEAIAAHFGASASFKEGGPAFLHPGRKAEVIVNGSPMGYIGELHPETQKRAEISERVYAAHLDIESLLSVETNAKRYKELSKFPSVQRDIALVVDEGTPAGAMMDAVKRACGALLEELELFDVYRSPLLGSGKKSLAFSLRLRADRTLTEEEISKAVSKAVRSLGAQFGAVLR